jgi:Protein of unknown function (DUF1583)
VRLHWIAGGNDAAEPIALSPRNAIDEPASRRGPGRLPLKAGDWNAVELAAIGDRIALRLNGLQILDRPMESANDLRFGFFRYQGQTQARVRNIVLRGEWPSKLDEQ